MKSYQSVAWSLVLGAVFLSGFLFAGEIEVSEQVRGKLADTAGNATASYSAQCEAWEKSVRADLGNTLIYSSCGAEETFSFHTSYRVTECYTQVTENGQTYEVCGDAWKDHAGYGLQTLSDGKLLISVEGEAGQLADNVAGEKTVCNAGDAKGCFAAREKAFESFRNRCQSFKDKAKGSFAARLLFASCGEPKNVMSVPAENEIQYRSKAVIFYRK